MEVWSARHVDRGGRERTEHHHLTDPWPQRTPLHGAAKDGVPVMVELSGHALRVLRVVSTYDVRRTGEGFRGTAWRLQLEDYRRVVVVHTAQGLVSRALTQEPCEAAPPLCLPRRARDSRSSTSSANRPASSVHAPWGRRYR
jgi:hypothetical protein